MERIAASVERHYGLGGRLEAIFEALRAMGKDLESLTTADLAPVDELHIRGREATMELARLAALSPGLRVLDGGCGLGGSTRYPASTYNCRVTGIDITLSRGPKSQPSAFSSRHRLCATFSNGSASGH